LKLFKEYKAHFNVFRPIGNTKRTIFVYQHSKQSNFMKKLLSMAALAGLLLTACSKDDSPATPSTFLPTTTGTYWRYQTQVGIDSIGVTGRDTTANGKTFKVFYSSQNRGSVYYGKVGSDYYRLGAFAALGTTPLELLYLKDNLAVGGNWESPYTINVPGVGNTNFKLKYSIGVKDSSMSVLGRNYTGVTRVKLDVFVVQFIEVNIGSGNFYYANNVGEIKSSLNISAPGQAPISTSTDLINYLIK
jgi:hypothetical protein